jgi:hypothetical protein
VFVNSFPNNGPTCHSIIVTVLTFVYLLGMSCVDGHNNTITCMSDYRRGLDCRMDILIAYEHDSGLEAIAAPPVITTGPGKPSGSKIK